MKVYFAFSIRGEKGDKDIINSVYNFLIKKGHKVMTEFNIIPKLDSKSLTEEDIFNRDIEALEKSDILLADVSKPSLGVGYEIAHAVNRKIEVIAFFKKETNLSCMIKGNRKVNLIEFNTIDDLLDKLNNYF